MNILDFVQPALDAEFHYEEGGVCHECWKALQPSTYMRLNFGWNRTLPCRNCELTFASHFKCYDDSRDQVNEDNTFVCSFCRDPL